MDPGELNNLVTLVGFYDGGRDGAGAPTKVRNPYADVWAKVTYAGGREFLANSGEEASRKAVFRIWAREDVDVAMAIRFRGVDWDIQDIRPFDDVLEIHTIAPAARPTA